MKKMLPLIATLFAAATTATANPSANFADNNRTLRAVTGVSITTREQLACIANDLSGSYVLDADIDLSGAPWTPLGSSSSPFTGKLYGQGHAITGLSFSDTSSGNSHGTYTGLFRYVRNATLEDVVLENVDVSGYQCVGALAGEVQGETSISNCHASGTVRSASTFAGMLVGRVSNSSLTTFDGCVAEGEVISSAANTGGLVGGIESSSANFSNCQANVDVSGTGGDNKGGFVGVIQNGSGSVFFDGCIAIGDVTAPGSSSVGGFVGNASRPIRCENCHAHGGANGFRYAGGFAGYVSGAGSAFDECSAKGDVITANGSRTGGFVGYVTSSNDFWRCMSSGSAKGTQYIGGFAGQLTGANTTVGECFVLGDATATQTGDSYAGGFVGDLYATAFLSDSYCLGTVTGRQKVGGFAGRNYSGNTRITRCYAAGAAECAGTYAGAFVGHDQNEPTFTDCAVLVDGFHAIGTGTAGSSTENANVAEFSAAGMKSAGNFQTWLAIDDEDGAVWTQTDGVTQPYLAWSADENGRLMVYASVLGSARGRIDGAGIWYEPGGVVTVTASSDEGFFVRWAGSTPYADPASSNTTFRLDNHRIAAVQFGLYVTDADELDAIRNDLSGVYGLANDIDLAGREWTPIGISDSVPFSGTLLGFGHTISNLTVNRGSSQYAGLFGCIGGGTVTDVRLVNPVVRGGNYTATLAGRLLNASIASGCSAVGAMVEAGGERVGGLVGDMSAASLLSRSFFLGDVTATSQYVGGLVGIVNQSGSTVSECFACGLVSSASGRVGGLVGWVGGGSEISDCYALESVHGTERVGGFVGHIEAAATSVARCYAAGGDTVGNSDVGGFAGYQSTSPSITNCFRLADGLKDIGAKDHAEITALDRAGMLAAANFGAFHATGKWSQTNGKTQPYFDWSLEDGKMALIVMAGGSVTGTVEGSGLYAPGANATLAATSAEGFFAQWTGAAPYADPSSATTTVRLDNHRVATARFGKYIANADELDAVRNDLSGIYGLTNDIDLSGRQWTPLGNNSTKFTGALYGFGHRIDNMVATNNPGSQYRGLFGYTMGATLDGITVTGKVRGTAEDMGGLVGRAAATLIANCTSVVEIVTTRQYSGGLVGRLESGTSIVGCSASGTLKSTHNMSGGLVGGVSAGVFEIRDSVSSVEIESDSSNVGGFIGYVYNGGESVISGCRADGYAGGNGDVGGFIGYAAAPITISNCVARGDVRSSGSNYGGFIGRLDNNNAIIDDCWCSGAVWGTGGTIGSFVGNKRNGKIRNCSVYAYGAGPRPFCGSDGTFIGGALAAGDFVNRTNGWPAVKLHIGGARVIRTAEDLASVSTDLAGVYVLANDIDLGGATISPIGNETAGFSGEFYGRGHKIGNFTVNSSERFAGLFGRIAGGRVSGVVLEGAVTGATDAGVGGFAGAIDSKSLVEGCSFQGAVTNATTCNAGGFVGSVSDSPVILRSCVLRAMVAANISGQSDSYAGGFVASLSGGYVMDCYAIADVNADGSYVGGFAGFVDGSITTAYCVGSVTSSGSYHGAFAGGSGDSGKITNSYYDYSKAGLGAVNNTDYTGVTGFSSQQMYHAANFAFDFDDVWKIDEGETTPYLRTFLEQLPEPDPELTGFQAFLVQYGLDVNTDPFYVTNGIPLIARYVYGIEPLDARTDVNGHPLIDFKMNANGTPVFELAPQKNADDYGLKFTILASPTLSPWITIDEYPFDPATDLCIPDLGTPPPPKMFFRWRLAIGN